MTAPGTIHQSVKETPSLLGYQPGIAQAPDRNRYLIVDHLCSGTGVEALGLNRPDELLARAIVQVGFELEHLVFIPVTGRRDPDRMVEVAVIIAVVRIEVRRCVGVRVGRWCVSADLFDTDYACNQHRIHRLRPDRSVQGIFRRYLLVGQYLVARFGRHSEVGELFDESILEQTPHDRLIGDADDQDIVDRSRKIAVAPFHQRFDGAGRQQCGHREELHEPYCETAVN